MIENGNCLWSSADFTAFDASGRTIATLSQHDFYQLRKRSKDFASWSDYEDFRMERDCEFLCACSAGVPARQQRVPLHLFRAWSRLTGAPSTLDRMDDYALRWRLRRERPNVPLMGALLSETDPIPPVLNNGAIVVPIAKYAFESWVVALAKLPAITSGSTLGHYVNLAAEAALPVSFKRACRVIGTGS